MPEIVVNVDYCRASHPRVNEVCRLAAGHPGQHHEPLAGSWPRRADVADSAERDPVRELLRRMLAV